MPAASFGGVSGSGGQWTVAADPATAYGMALQAVQGGGARVVSENPPHSMKLSKSKGGFRYDGQLQLQPLGPSQTALRLTFKPSSGAIAVVAISGLVGVMTMPYMLGSLGALVSLGITCWLLWSMTRSEPALLAETVLSTLPQSGGHGAPTGPAVRPAAPIPPSAPAAPPAPAAAVETEDGPSSTFERIKQLAELKAMGVLSPEEFDLKKAELLKRL
jgi:hypothetical protein